VNTPEFSFNVIVQSVAAVNNPPIFTDDLYNQFVNEGASGSYILPATSDPESNTVTVVVDTKPTWVSFDSATNTFAFSPPAASASTYPINLRITDGTNTVPFSFKIIVQTAPANGAPSFASTPPL